MHHFQYKDGVLCAEDVRLDQLAEEVGTPFYCYSTATDLADWVVRVLKKPFREAHHIAGSIVKLAETKGVTLDKLSLAEMKSVDPDITQEVFKVLSPEASVASRMSLGGTAPARVKEQLHYWRSMLK